MQHREIIARVNAALKAEGIELQPLFTDADAKKLVKEGAIVEKVKDGVAKIIQPYEMSKVQGDASLAIAPDFSAAEFKKPVVVLAIDGFKGSSGELQDKYAVLGPADMKVAKINDAFISVAKQISDELVADTTRGLKVEDTGVYYGRQEAAQRLLHSVPHNALEFPRRAGLELGTPNPPYEMTGAQNDRVNEVLAQLANASAAAQPVVNPRGAHENKIDFAGVELSALAARDEQVYRGRYSKFDVNFNHRMDRDETAALMGEKQRFGAVDHTDMDFNRDRRVNSDDVAPGMQASIGRLLKNNASARQALSAFAVAAGEQKDGTLVLPAKPAAKEPEQKR